MTARRRTQYVRPRPLSWAPPTLTTPTTVNVSLDASARLLILDPAKDYIVKMPNAPVGPVALARQSQAQVTVSGGRNVVLIGGQVSIPPAPAPTTLAVTYNDGDTVAYLNDITGLQTSGSINVGGYALTYTGMAGSVLTGVRRSSFAYSTALPLPLPVGTPVWIGEPHRGGITFLQQTGTVHVEGLLIDGDLVDGLRFDTDTAGTTFQVQNVRVDQGVSHDTAHQYDGHPDAIQLISGPATFRMDRVSLFSEGRGILNKNDATQNCALVQARDVVMTGSRSTTPGDILWDSSTPGTAWEVANCWGRLAHTTVRTSGSTALAGGVLEPDQYLDFVPAESVGLGYVSPGYLP